MKKKNTFFPGLLVVLLTIGLIFAGCGDDNDSSNNDGDGTNTSGINTGGNNSGGNNSGGNNSGGNNSGSNDNGGDNGGNNNSGGNNNGGGTTVPSYPTGVTATAQSSNSISVSWNAVTGATSYKVYYEIGSSTIKNLADTVSGTSYTHTGLQASTTYYYYIKAVNSAGESDYSSFDYATTQSSNNSGGNNSGGTTAPSTPTGVTATAQSSSSIRVSWNAVSGATPSYYNIWRSSSANGTYAEIGYVGGTTTSYTDTSLSASTTYYYKVDAEKSGVRSSQSSYAFATTQSSNSGGGGTTVTKPSAPTGVTASRTPRSNQYVTVSWNTVSGATSYKIYRSSTASGTYELAGYATSSPSDRFFYNDTTSYWKVSAVNDAGESALSSTYGTALGWQQ